MEGESTEREIEIERLSLLLRLALGGNLPPQPDGGKAIGDRREVPRLAESFADVGPLNLEARLGDLAADEVLRGIAEGLLRWLPLDPRDLDGGLSLRAEHLALIRLLAQRVAHEDGARLVDLDDHLLTDHVGAALVRIKPDTAARWRTVACRTIAAHLMRRYRPIPVIADASLLGPFLVGGWPPPRLEVDGSLTHRFGLTSALTDGEVPAYVRRDSDDELDARLAAGQLFSSKDDDRLVLVSGPPKAGKTRTLVEAIQHRSGRWAPRSVVALPIRQPRPGESLARELVEPLRKLTRDDGEARSFVVIFDDMHAHLLNGLLPRHDVDDLLAIDRRVFVVGTIHDAFLIPGLPTPGYNSFDVDRLAAHSIALRPDLSRDEQKLARLALGPVFSAKVDAEDLLRLPETFAAVQNVASWGRLARVESDSHPERHAVIEAAIDAQMAFGRFTEDQLYGLWELWFKTLAPKSQREKRTKFNHALDWAETRFGTSQLLEWSDDGTVLGKLHDRAALMLLPEHQSHQDLPRLLSASDRIRAAINYSVNGRFADAEGLLLPGAERHELLAMRNLIEILVAQGRLEEAERWCRRSIDTHDDVSAINALGFIRKGQGSLDEAETLFRDGASRDDLTCIFNVGVLLDQSSRYKTGAEAAARQDEARDFYLRAAERGHAGAMVNLGVMNERDEHPIEAECWFRASLRAGRSEAVPHLANLLLRLSRPDEAKDLYRFGASRLDVTSAVALASMHLLDRERDAGIRWLKFAAVRGNADAMLQLAVLIDDDDESEHWLDRAADAGNVEAIYLKAELTANAGDLVAAMGLYTRAASLGDLPSLFAVALVQQRSGRLDNARHNLETLSDAGYPPAMRELSKLLRDSGATDAADRWDELAESSAEVLDMPRVRAIAKAKERISELGPVDDRSEFATDRAEPGRDATAAEGKVSAEDSVARILESANADELRELLATDPSLRDVQFALSIFVAHESRGAEDGWDRKAPLIAELIGSSVELAVPLVLALTSVCNAVNWQGADEQALEFMVQHLDSLDSEQVVPSLHPRIASQLLLNITSALGRAARQSQTPDAIWSRAIDYAVACHHLTRDDAELLPKALNNLATVLLDSYRDSREPPLLLVESVNYARLGLYWAQRSNSSVGLLMNTLSNALLARFSESYDSAVFTEAVLSASAAVVDPSWPIRDQIGALKNLTLLSLAAFDETGRVQFLDEALEALDSFAWDDQQAADKALLFLLRSLVLADRITSGGDVSRLEAAIQDGDRIRQEVETGTTTAAMVEMAGAVLKIAQSRPNLESIDQEVQMLVTARERLAVDPQLQALCDYYLAAAGHRDG